MHRAISSRRLWLSPAFVFFAAAFAGGLLRADNNYAQPYAFKTFAGHAPGGARDGAASVAQFYRPWGVAVDRQGNVFVTDTNNHTIRKIGTDGIVSTLAGQSGEPGAQDGVGAAARFDVPWGLAIDQNGVLYVTDEQNQTIRKVTKDGVVTTLAGAVGVAGLVDGEGAQARFASPRGIAVDLAGNVYTTDWQSDSIRKISPGGRVTTIAGGTNGDRDGVGRAAQFDCPGAVAVDAGGVLYVADSNNNSIRKITPEGVVTTFAASTTRPYSVAFSFGVAVDATGTVYVASGGVKKISPGGVISPWVGGAEVGSADGVGTAAQFNFPTGVALDAGGNLYVVDTLNCTIRKVSAAGAVSTLAGLADPVGGRDGYASLAQFQMPAGMAFDRAGNLYVADGQNDAVRKISSAGVVTSLPGSFFSPADVAADSAGNVYVSDATPAVFKITPGGVVTTVGGSSGFAWPTGLAIDRNDNLYVADTAKNSISKITPAGVVSLLAGGSAGSADGVGAAAKFNGVTGLALGNNDDLYAADTQNHTVRRIALNTGEVATVAGAPGQAGSTDGSRSDARFSTPADVAVNANGEVFVIDSGNHLIRQISPSGAVTTAAGKAGVFGRRDAAGSEARFSAPGAVAIDATGRIWVADSGNNSIRIGVPPGAATRTANIATRAYCGANDRVTIGGFVVAGGGSKRVLVRAVGSSLTKQGLDVAEVLADPTIEVHDASHGNAVLTSVDNWGDNANAAEVTATAATVGATPLLASDTKSAAALLTLEPGVYSFVVKGKGSASGIVLLEVYDADAASNGSNFTNIATRAYATTGNGVTIGGFVISGSAPKQILLRAVGPTLTTQGIAASEALADPMIELHDANHGNVVVATNDNLADNVNALEIRVTAARVGAAPLATADTKSAALLLTLQPGVYSFIANGKGGTSGIVLLEVYDAD